MNVLEKILEEIEDHVNMVKNIPVNEDDDFLDGEECYEAGRIQGRYEELVSVSYTHLTLPTNSRV